MKNNENEKTKIEFGVLPPVLQGGIVFKALTYPAKQEHKQYKSVYRRRLYKLMNELLKEESPQSHTSYTKWFENPEKNVTQAFLYNERKDAEKWFKLVNIMRFAILQVLTEALQEGRTHIRFYKEHDKLFSKYLTEETESLKTESHV